MEVLKFAKSIGDLQCLVISKCQELQLHNRGLRENMCVEDITGIENVLLKLYTSKYNDVMALDKLRQDIRTTITNIRIDALQREIFEMQTDINAKYEQLRSMCSADILQKCMDTLHDVNATYLRYSESTLEFKWDVVESQNKTDVLLANEFNIFAHKLSHLLASAGEEGELINNNNQVDPEV